jgi:phospholipase C
MAHTIRHLIVLMLENRSFDHMLGFLYADSGNVAPTGQAFEGLKGAESNPDGKGGTVIRARVTLQPTRSCSAPPRLPLPLSPPTAVS